MTARPEFRYGSGEQSRRLDELQFTALIRLRAYAFAQGLTASEAAWAIVARRVSLDDEESFRPPTDGGGGTT